MYINIDRACYICGVYSICCLYSKSRICSVGVCVYIYVVYTECIVYVYSVYTADVYIYIYISVCTVYGCRRNASAWPRRTMQYSVLVHKGGPNFVAIICFASLFRLLGMNISMHGISIFR